MFISYTLIDSIIDIVLLGKSTPIILFLKIILTLLIPTEEIL
nr:MAG TPA: hypothetical protein [Caudoviricetes sp.]